MTQAEAEKERERRNKAWSYGGRTKHATGRLSEEELRKKRSLPLKPTAKAVPQIRTAATSEQKDTSAADAAQQPAQPAVATAAQTIVPPAPEQRAAGPIKRRPAQLAADLRGST